MKVQTADISVFAYNLSAFLSACRSCFQYICTLVEKTDGNTNWYNNKVANDPKIKFLKNKRDINTHKDIIRTRKDVHLMLTDTLHVNSVIESIHIRIFDNLGNLIGDRKSEGSPKHEKYKEIPPVTTSIYRFKDWNGNESVLDLADYYLSMARGLIDATSKAGYIN
jgi:hypothetical protein